MWKCQVFGHDFEFRPEGRTMVWSCTRRCGAAGSKRYADIASAERYAKTLNRRTNDDLGRRAPLIGLLPLRLWRRLHAATLRAGRH